MTDGLAEKYLEYGRTEREDLFWAWEEVTNLVLYAPHEAWPFVLQLIGLAPDESLAYVAAGPLEDFLCEHGDAFLSALRSAAENDARLRQALCGVWGKNRMNAIVWDEVQRLCGRKKIGPN